MKVACIWRSVMAAALVLVAGVGASGETRHATPGICSKGTNYEALGYIIRDARIEDPWRFMRLGAGDDEAEKATQGLNGKTYNTLEVNNVFKVVENKRLLTNSEISYSTIELENCSDKQVDVVFKVFSVQISPLFSSTFEFRQSEKNNPQEAAGVANKRNVKFVPVAGYDPTNKFFGGGSAEAKWEATGMPFDSLSLAALEGSSTRSASAALSGRYESATRLLSSVDWRLDYQYSSVPTDRARFNSGRLALQVKGTTRPLNGLILRFGARGEGGNQQSDFAAADLAPRTLPSSAYSSLKFYGGLTAHPRNQAFAASYGLEIGSAGTRLRGDWRKHIADFAHEFWMPVGDHREVDIEQRLTAGAVQTLHFVPVKSLFFGGNREEQFIPGDTWSIRSNPVIRSIPANRFYRTRDGAGGERFVSYNSTIAITAWRKPLVPRELTEDPEFKKKMHGALVSSTSILQVTYASDDNHFHDALKLLPDIADKLQALSDAMPSSGDCTDAIDSALLTVKNAKKAKPARAYGSVKELLPGGDDDLENVVTLCKTDPDKPSVIAAADALGRAAKPLQTTFALIDQDAATKKAEMDMVFVKRTLNIILNDLNIASVSPLFIFDVAHVGPKASGPFSGTRYGVGGGIRFSLVNMVNFSGGYAVNPSRRPGEPPGAVFFSLSTRSLFR